MLNHGRPPQENCGDKCLTVVLSAPDGVLSVPQPVVGIKTVFEEIWIILTLSDHRTSSGATADAGKRIHNGLCNIAIIRH